MSWLIWSQIGLNKQSEPIRFQSRHHDRRPMPSLLLAPPKTLRNTVLVLLARQKMEIPVRSGKIPMAQRYISSHARTPGNANSGPTLRNDLPNKHD